MGYNISKVFNDEIFMKKVIHNLVKQLEHASSKNGVYLTKITCFNKQHMQK